MKRVLIILCCICLIVCLAVPCFAESLDPNDFIGNIESVGENESIYTFVIPATSFTSYNLEVLNSSGTRLAIANNQPLTYSVDSSSMYIFGVQPFAGSSDWLEVGDFPKTFTIDINCETTFSGGAAIDGSDSTCRYQLWWYDDNGNSLGVQHTNYTYNDGGLFAQTLEVTKPDTATRLKVIGQARDVHFSSSGTFTMNFVSLTFSMNINDLVRLQQETGRTNKLLESIMNYKPLPELPFWNDSMNDAIQKEDSLVDKFNDGTLENFGSQIADATDQLLMYSAAFTLWFFIWDRICDIPWINTLLVCSLALGLLGAFLGMGMAAGRAVSRSEVRSRKKGS